MQSIHLPVFTEAGVSLGKVADIIWDADAKVIVQLVVRQGIVGKREFLIHTSQIARVERDKLVVSANFAGDAPAQALFNKTLKKFAKLGARPAPGIAATISRNVKKQLT